MSPERLHNQTNQKIVFSGPASVCRNLVSFKRRSIGKVAPMQSPPARFPHPLFFTFLPCVVFGPRFGCGFRFRRIFRNWRFMFATSMVISGLSQFDWAVYVLAAGAFILATVDATLLSIDSIVLTKEESWNSPVATRPTPQ